VTQKEGFETAESIKDSPRVKFALEHLAGGQRFLDIGCNTGWFMDLLDCKEKWGLDIDTSFKKTIESKGYKFITAASWETRISKNSFDRIHFGQTMAHMRRELAINSLKEIGRILAPKGKAVVSTVVGPNFTSGIYWARTGTLVSSVPPWYHTYEWEPPELWDIFKQTNLTPLKFKIMPQEDESSKTYKDFRLVQSYVLGKKKDDWE
jgi:SAM-dependent methyltransferase